MLLIRASHAPSSWALIMHPPHVSSCALLILCSHHALSSSAFLIRASHLRSSCVFLVCDYHVWFSCALQILLATHCASHHGARFSSCVLLIAHAPLCARSSSCALIVLAFHVRSSCALFIVLAPHYKNAHHVRLPSALFVRAPHHAGSSSCALLIRVRRSVCPNFIYNYLFLLFLI